MLTGTDTLCMTQGRLELSSSSLHPKLAAVAYSVSIVAFYLTRLYSSASVQVQYEEAGVWQNHYYNDVMISVSITTKRCHAIHLRACVKNSLLSFFNFAFFLQHHRPCSKS